MEATYVTALERVDAEDLPGALERHFDIDIARAAAGQHALSRHLARNLVEFFTDHDSSSLLRLCRHK
jgi:hypothetical protein